VSTHLGQALQSGAGPIQSDVRPASSQIRARGWKSAIAWRAPARVHRVRRGGCVWPHRRGLRSVARVPVVDEPHPAIDEYHSHHSQPV